MVISTSQRHSNEAQLVAATFAVARCGGLGHSKPEDYIAEYDSFLRLLMNANQTLPNVQ
jgi:hypothetical protein